MPWRDDLRQQLVATLRRHARAMDDTDAARSVVVANAFDVAENVMSFTQSELLRHGINAAHTSASDAQSLTVNACFLHASLIMGGLAIKVRRETGIVDLLHAEHGVMVDGQLRAVGLAESYFGRLIIDVVACGVPK